jgi:hypothetical protein
VSAPAALSKLARLGLSAIGATSPVNLGVQFQRLHTGAEEQVLDTARDVNFGSLTHSLSRAVENLRRAQPSMTLKPNVGELKDSGLLQWCMGGAPTGTTTITYPLAAARLLRNVGIDDTARYTEIQNAAVDVATFHAQSGGELYLDLDVVGTDFTNAGSLPALTQPTGPPFLMGQLALNVGGTTPVYVESFRLTLNNHIDRNRYFNSFALPDVIKTDRTVEIEIPMPLGTHFALWNAGAGSAGVSVTATFTSAAGKVLVFSMPSVRSGDSPYDLDVPREVIVPWRGMALSDTADAELSTLLTW